MSEKRLLERYLKPCPAPPDGCGYPVSQYDPQQCCYFCGACGKKHYGPTPTETEPRKAPLLPSEQRVR